MFRPLAFEAMRQQADQTGHAQPFGFARVDELIEHDLRAIGKIAKLGFPHHQRVRFRQRIAIFEPEHRIFRQHRIDHLVPRLSGADVVERVVAFFGALIDKGRVALAEGAARAILPRQAHRKAFGDQAAKGQSLGRGPVEPLAGGEHGGLRLQLAGDGLVQIEAVGNAGQGRADFGHCGR